jgi:hypothetical protein
LFDANFYFFERLHLVQRVGTARCAVRAAFSGAICDVLEKRTTFVPPAVTRAGTSQRDVPTNSRQFPPALFHPCLSVFIRG